MCVSTDHAMRKKLQDLFLSQRGVVYRHLPFLFGFFQTPAPSPPTLTNPPILPSRPVQLAVVPLLGAESPRWGMKSGENQKNEVYAFYFLDREEVTATRKSTFFENSLQVVANACFSVVPEGHLLGWLVYSDD